MAGRRARTSEQIEFTLIDLKKNSTAASSSVIPAPPNLSGQALRSNWNATALAYLGDAVWELYARRAHFSPPKRLTALYDLVTASVRAEAQAAFAERLEAGGFLSEAEKDVLRWGRNAKVTMPKRFVGGKARDNGPRKKGNKDGGGGGEAAAAASSASSSSSSSSSSSPPTKTIVSGPHANVYRSATALECLVGYLYVTDSTRLQVVMRYLGLGGPEDEEGGLAAAALAAAAARGEGGSAFVSSGSSSSNEDEDIDASTSSA